MKKFEEKPIIALDFPSLEEVKAFLGKFPQNEALFVKIGMELFYKEGPEVVRYVKSLGHQVFLDLKLYDIPNTVASAMKVLAQLDIDIIDLHAAGGIEMMKAAKSGLEAGLSSGQKMPELIAVTQLTSVTEQMVREEQLVNASLAESVTHYAKSAMTAGLSGVVCSAFEVAEIKKVTREDFICLTPGIRPEASQPDDQKRVMTPSQARAAGSSYIVVGRPIIKSPDPLAAYQMIKNDWNN